LLHQVHFLAVYKQQQPGWFTRKKSSTQAPEKERVAFWASIKSVLPV
jgi:hypothetical protein